MTIFAFSMVTTSFDEGGRSTTTWSSSRSIRPRTTEPSAVSIRELAYSLGDDL